ncbi:MAG TPA: methyltransferase, partial [Verrucomicrobiae bacterium]
NLGGPSAHFGLLQKATLMSSPLHLGTTPQFARVRDFFADTGFNASNLCQTLGLRDMSDLGLVRWDELPADKLSASLRWCLEAFVRGVPVSEAESSAACGPATLSALTALGLLRPAHKTPGALVCPVWVYPVDGFVVASDRRDDPEGGSCIPEEDVVFPAIYAGTLRFLNLLPLASAGDALDLCGGTGIGALHLSRTARRSVSADVTGRAAFFADFNARLNGVEITSACGDLYAPVAGSQFDLISAHPPFVPATGPKMVYRDAGDTGEEITRRIVEELPTHLRTGGTCVILCVARDTAERPFEQRAREWLGTAGDQFDIVFGLEKVLTVEGVVESIRKRGQQISQEQARDLVARLRSLGTRQFVYGALFLRRYAQTVPDEPLRIQLSPEGCAADFDRLLRWRAHCRRADINHWLAGSRPRLAPRLELTVRHTVRDGELVPAEFVFSIAEGFEAALRPDAWIVPLLARLEGKHSVEDIFRQAAAAGDLPQGFAFDDFADLVRKMIERGFLQVDLA